MTDYGTIKIPREEYERHNERREEMGVTWAAYIDGEAPPVPEVDEHAIAQRVADEIETRLR